MSSDDQYRTTGATTAQDATGVGRSAEYNDGLTVQDTSRSAASTQNASYGATTDVNRATGSDYDTSMRSGTDDVSRDETGNLISADKVQGTAVYDASGERLGTIDSIMLDKVSGKVAYAVMSFGGFLGIGERYHPLPWNVLKYDEAKGGYNVAQTADALRSAPNYSRDEVGAFDYGTRGREIDDYYGVNTGRGTAGLDTGQVRSGDVAGSTTGAGSSGMASTGMGANRNY